MDINAIIAQELKVHPKQVAGAVALLDEGATVPFIARYRKEVTGSLDDTQLRTLEERLRYLRELDERRLTIIESIEKQGKLTPELRHKILQADNKTSLEDLYLPYKPKRRTKATIAREAGLEPLSTELRENPDAIPLEVAAAYIDEEKKVPDAATALEGAQAILMEDFAENADLLASLRAFLQERGCIISTVIEDAKVTGQKFSDYFNYREPLASIASHRVLALLRGRREKVLRLKLGITGFEAAASSVKSEEFQECIALIKKFNPIVPGNETRQKWFDDVYLRTWRIKLGPKLELECISALREQAEEEAIKVFAANVRDVLMAPPAGPRSIIGIDPGLRTGCKVAVIDKTGKFLEACTIYPHPPHNRAMESIKTLQKLAMTHKAHLVAIGNGTASRETDILVNQWFKAFPNEKLTKVIVSEAGASVYSASELAAKEFPDLDVSLRGAVSIARRLQDPLAELVKIDPKSIGVGQYQHDVNQNKLAKALANVVEDCVNAVGVNLNTASVSLLAYVSGLNERLAQAIVTYRNEHGAFKSRTQLLEVPRLGAKTYELAAGFLRIRGGDNPLDASAVHPEAYPLVEKIAQSEDMSLNELIGNSDYLSKISPQKYVDQRFGLPTIKDILAELEKPGRDPRKEFEPVSFKEGVETIDDLEEGMELPGVVTNVTNFGAFVDVGVHNDGLVHISEMADRFVKNPREIVHPGDRVTVRVIKIDKGRMRIGLSMRKKQSAPAAKQHHHSHSNISRKAPSGNRQRKANSQSAPRKNKLTSALGKALLESLEKKKQGR